MKTTKRLFGSLLTLALAFMLALTAVVPTFAAPVDQENLTVRIRNNDGLPAMSETQFDVYQIFTGTPNKEKEAQSNDWDAENWNNYTLADIEWGASVQDNAQLTLLTALQSADWAVVDGKNVFADASTATQVAEALVGRTNKFLQNFAKTVLAIPTIKTVTLEPGNPALDSGKPDDPADDSLTFTLPDTGYYLFAENAAEHTEGDAVSEYMLAVVGEQDILLKASVPTVDKNIVTDAGDKKGDVDGVGEEVTFKLTGTLPKNFGDFDFYEYTFEDTLSNGLQFLEGTEEAADPLANMTVTVTLPLADGATKKYEIPLKELVRAAYTYPKDPESADLNYTEALPYLNDRREDAENPHTDLLVDFRDLKKLEGYALTAEGTREEPAKLTVIPWETATDITKATIEVIYKAVVTEDAVILNTGNPNTVDLRYSNDPNNRSMGKTEKKKVYVYAFGLDLTKVGSDAPEKGLPDAGFIMKNEAGDYALFKDQYVSTDGQKFSDEKTAECGEGPVRRLAKWEKSATVQAMIDAYDKAEKALENASDAEKSEKQAAVEEAKKAFAAYLLESDASGKIPNVYGLGDGKYALEEVITPAGYNTMNDFDIEIQAVINESSGALEKITYKHGDETVTYFKTADKYTTGNLGDEDVPETDEIGDRVARFHSGLLKDNIENQKAPFLPFTGGMGTLIFYILGVVLIAGAVTYLVIASKKRKKAQENT